MKRFNKALAILLIITMAFAMVGTAGAIQADGSPDGPPQPETGAKEITISSELSDFGSITHKEAVSIMVKLGLINGIAENGGYAFKPAGSIDRASMAKIVALAVTLMSGDKITGSATFSDTAGTWAADYIAYCSDLGLISGDGAFNPRGSITGREAADMLLAAMGSDAAAQDLYSSLSADMSAPLTRDDAAQLVYNALLASDGSAALPCLIVAAGTTEYKNFTVGGNTLVIAPEGKLVTLTANGTEQDIKAGTTYSGDVVLTATDAVVPLDGPTIGSYSNRGHEPFRAAVYVDKTGVVDSKSVKAAVAGGTVTDTEAVGITINSTGDNFSGIIVNGGTYTIKDSTINLTGKSDGSNTNDFTGLGAAVSAFNGATIILDNVTIATEGVARPALYADTESDIMYKNSTFKVMGGTLYDGYVNTADQNKMVAPPWVLGITGNARGTNLMGQSSTTTVVNCVVSANEWGVLSTDAGKAMGLTVIDSTLSLIGDSGYGTYVIGDAQEYFYGVEFNVATYAIIMTGGAATFASSNGTFDIYNYKSVGTGEFEEYPWGREEATRTERDEVIFPGIQGKGNSTVVNSKAFGLMAHNSGTITIKDKTAFNTENAVFLMKAGDVDIAVDDSTLSPKDGVIFQVIDNDDALVGADMSQGAPNFYTEFSEAVGYPGIDYAVEVSTGGRNTYTFAGTNVALEGNFYNASGYFGGQAGDLLTVTLGKGATLKGIISSSSAIHSTDGGATQNTYFTISEYYKLGHVANKAYYNGANDVEVVLKDGAAWTVTGTSYLSSLTVGAGCTLNGTVTVDGQAVIVELGVTYTGAIVVSAK